jgi:hypothetical protein
MGRIILACLAEALANCRSEGGPVEVLMPLSLPSWVVRCAAAGVLVLGIGVAAGSVSAQDKKRTVYVSVLNKDTPVTDMEAADFELKDGGKVQEISVKPATASMRVSFLVADWGTGSFQAGIQRFMERLLGNAEYQLVSLLPQPVIAMNWAYDPRSLSAGLAKIGTRGRQQGAQVIEAIHETSKTIRGSSKRPVIVVLRIGNDSISTLPGNTVREELRKSGAILEVVNLGVRTSASGSMEGGTAAGQQARFQDMEQKDSAFALAQVLGDGSRETGGRNEQVISTTLTDVLASIADELLHQYEITYTSTQPKPGEKIQVASKRKGLTVRAPHQARY